jgi:hypothetical protein
MRIRLDPFAGARRGQPGSRSGRGLAMRAFLDEVTFNARGNEVTLVKRRETAPGCMNKKNSE